MEDNKIQEENIFKEGELVEVSDDMENGNIHLRVYLTTLSREGGYRHLCVREGNEENYKTGEDFSSDVWRCIRKHKAFPKKTITIEVTPEQEKAINKIIGTT